MQLNKLKTILVNKQKTKPQAITKKKTKKIEWYVQIKIFNLVKRGIYPVVFAKFVY